MQLRTVATENIQMQLNETKNPMHALDSFHFISFLPHESGKEVLVGRIDWGVGGAGQVVARRYGGIQTCIAQRYLLMGAQQASTLQAYH